jgi:hypothetical protein
VASNIVLAFNASNSYTTSQSCNKELYTTGKNAIEKAASVNDLVYNKTFVLPDNINIHYTLTNDGGATSTEKTITLTDALAKWGLTASYEKFNYTLGTSTTSESEYIAINEGVVNVRYATTATDGTYTWSDVKGDEGRSAIGKHPAVRVTLRDGANNVVAVGFIKFAIVDKAADEPVAFDIADGSFDYICDAANAKTVKSEWKNMSGVAQALNNITKDEFVANYTPEYVSGSTVDCQTYIKSATGAYTKVANNKYGNITYSTDGTAASSTNVILTWTYSKAAAEEIRKLSGSKVTLYTKFTSGTGSAQITVYLGLTITINAQPSIEIGTIQDANQVDNDPQHVFMSVRGAKNGILTVRDFYYNFPEYYNYNDGAYKPQVFGAGSLSNITLTYRFADSQPTGLTVSTDKQSVLQSGATIATIDKTTGKLEYAHNATSMKLLNGGSNVSNASVKVQIDATYGTCNIPFESISKNVVTVDFYKPIFVKGSTSYDVEFSNVDGATKTPLAALITMTDTWTPKSSLFDYNATTGTATDTNGIYDYYEIQSIDVDLSAYKTSNLGGAIFSMEGPAVTANGNDKYTVDATSVANLASSLIVTDYRNAVINNDASLTFPVTVNYYWGSQESKVTVKIKPNTSNSTAAIRRK